MLSSRVADVSIPGDYQYRALHHGPRVQRFWHRNKLRLIRQLTQGVSCDLLVDLGCGSGNMLFGTALQPKRALGLDASVEATAFGVRHRPTSSIWFAVASGEALPLPDGQVDLLLFSEVVEHLTHPDRVLGEIARVLKPGGRVVMTTPNYRWPSPWPALERVADWSGRVAQMRDAQHVQQFSPESLSELARSRGLQIARLGTFYLWSPLVAVLSASWADRVLDWELRRDLRHGCLIYCVASKPS